MPTPRGDFGGLAGRGCLGPYSVGRFEGLARGPDPHPRLGCPGPHLGVSNPTPGEGCSGPHPGRSRPRRVYPSMH